MRKSALIVTNASNLLVVGQNISFFCLLYRRDPFCLGPPFVSVLYPADELAKLYFRSGMSNCISDKSKRRLAWICCAASNLEW